MKQDKNVNFKINDIDIDFVTKMLKSLPSNIYFKDQEGKYVFCTHYWNHINMDENDKNWSIRGKYDVDIRKDKENALKAMEEDQKILKNKVGVAYEIKIEIEDGLEYYQVIKDPVFDDKGNVIGIVGLINDITRTKLLEEKLERMATRDPLTDVYNRSYIDIWIEKNKDTNIFPISVVVADCNGLKKVNDKYGHLVGDQYIIQTAKSMEKFLPLRGCVIRSGGDEFIAFLPDTDQQGAEKYIKEVQNAISSVRIFDEVCSVAMGSATLQDNNIKIEEIIRIADDEMYIQKAKYHLKHGR